MTSEPNDEDRNRAIEFIAAALFIGVLLVLIIVSVRANIKAGDDLALMYQDYGALQGKLARSEMLVEEYRQDNAYLEAENLRLNSLPPTVKVVYRCEEKRTPVFAPEWHLKVVP